MSKTPEELVEDYTSTLPKRNLDVFDIEMAFLAGYQAGYERGYERGVEVLHMTYKAAAPQWISVKDRLPELRQKVLVWYDNGYEVAFLQKFEPPKLQYPQFNNVEMFEWCFGDFEDFDVTHWMPLPKPPEE